jgi:CubicO group peptidase (beta-lactamase class C family)
LVETGKLSLSDTITKWFSEYPFLNSVTIDHLLLYTSGILTFENVRANRLPPNEYISAEQTVKNVFEAKPELLFTPVKRIITQTQDF